MKNFNKKLIGKNCFSRVVKLLMVMKLTAILIMVSTFGLLASETYAQSKRLTLKMENAKVEEVLANIQKQSEFYFFVYSEKVIDADRRVTVNLEEQNIETVLQTVFAGTDVAYLINDRLIVLTTPEVLGKVSPAVAQQQPAVSGTVTDQSGQPLPGVTVVVKGTTRGTVTNADGEYSISSLPEDATLQFSFVGMRTQEVVVGNQTSIDVRMEVEAIGIEEVVAVGYGTQLRKDMTGSVTKISSEDFIEPSASNFDQMLQGKVPGLEIKQTSGAPGGNVNVLVRGINSITGGNQPLWVIDGFPISISEGSTDLRSLGSNMYSSIRMANNTAQQINPLSFLSPSDIESIEILKDASATAIYGSRGANGVIIVTTKRGSGLKTQFDVDVSYGIQEVSHRMEVMDAKSYAEYVAIARDNTWVYLGGKASDPNSVRPTNVRVRDEFRDPSSITTNTDWQDMIFRIAPVQNYKVSASGGTEKLQYLISGGFFDQEGVIKTSDYKRFNLRTNIDAKILKNLKIGSSLSGSYGYGSFPNAVGHYGTGGILNMALAAAPTIPAYDSDGNPYFDGQDVTDGLGWLVNPLTVLDMKKYSDLRTTANMIVNNYLEYAILDGLTFRSTVGINYNVSQIKLWRTSAVPLNTSLNYPATAAVTQNTEIDWLNENTFNYKHLFNNKHLIDALIGFSSQKNSYQRLSAGATDFPTDYVSYLSAGIVNAGTHIKSEWSMMSFISRFNYSYKSKYLATATFRSDGSSRFGSKNRWGTFPSFSVGYNISEEPFMKSLSAINNLKIRASYGLSGNNLIGNYAAIGLLGGANYVEGEKKVPGLVPSSLSNDDLTWEISKQFNLGLELGLFNDRILMTADIYKNKKTDLLLQVRLPAASGFTSSTQNIGDIENKGVELQFRTINIKSHDFNWTSNIVFSANKNKVVKLATESDRIVRDNLSVIEVGYPIASYYLLKQIGIFQTPEEVANSALQHPNIQPGDIKFQDYNGDGKINTEDKQVVGDPWPDFNWGINNIFSYKNLSLGIAINGVEGAQTYFLAGRAGGLANAAGVQNQITAIDHWISESDPGDGVTPRPIRNNYGQSLSDNSRYLFDASYIKIKNINLSYVIPSRISNKFSISNLTVYGNISNVYTFTDYPGYDPESSSAGNNILSSGIDQLSYPLARTYTIGVKLLF